MKQAQINAVEAHMTQLGYSRKSYTIAQGNKCLWVYGHRMDWYFIFNDNDDIIDVQID